MKLTADAKKALKEFRAGSGTLAIEVVKVEYIDVQYTNGLSSDELGFPEVRDMSQQEQVVFGMLMKHIKADRVEKVKIVDTGITSLIEAFEKNRMMKIGSLPSADGRGTSQVILGQIGKRNAVWLKEPYLNFFLFG